MTTIETDDSGREMWYFQASAALESPFHWVAETVRYRLFAPLNPERLDNANYKIVEVATRIFITLSAILGAMFAGTFLLFTAVILGTASKVLRAFAVSLQKEGFTHVRGEGRERILSDKTAKVLTWKIRGQTGGLHYKTGGVVHWRSRLDAILAKIAAEKPDVLVLLEVDDPDLQRELLSRLTKEYAHIYAHIGESVWETGSSMVFTKCAVASFTREEFEDSSLVQKKGFEVMELRSSPKADPFLRLVIGDIVEGEAAVRNRHFGQIRSHLKLQETSLPTLFTGCIHPDELRERAKDLSNGYRGHDPLQTKEFASVWNADVESETTVAALVKRNDSLPVIEKTVQLEDLHLVESFTGRNDPKPLSDLNGISVTLHIASPKKGPSEPRNPN